MNKILVVTLVAVGMFLFCGNVQADLNNGLLTYYLFNGNANDESGNGNNGTINGATLTADRNGNAYSAYSFDGATDYIYIGKPVPSSLATTKAITLAAWINPTAYPSGVNPNEVGLIIGSQCDACGTAGTAIHLDGRNVHGGIRGGIHFQIGLENIGWTANTNEGTTNVDVPLNQWSYIVATWKSGDTKKVYINGKLVTNWTTVWTGSIKYDSSTEMNIGRQPDIGRYFNGSIDDTRIYNRALSESEIQELYNESACSQSELDAKYEAGKQYCIDNPEECGISTGGGGYTKADLDAKYQEGFTAGKKTTCDTSNPPVSDDNCASFNMFTNILHIPCLDLGESYWLDLTLQGQHLEISDFGTN